MYHTIFLTHFLANFFVDERLQSFLFFSYSMDTPGSIATRWNRSSSDRYQYKSYGVPVAIHVWTQRCVQCELFDHIFYSMDDNLTSIIDFQSHKVIPNAWSKEKKENLQRRQMRQLVNMIGNICTAHPEAKYLDLFVLPFSRWGNQMRLQRRRICRRCIGASCCQCNKAVVSLQSTTALEQSDR